MKTILALTLTFTTIFTAYCQQQEVERDWTSFVQSIKVNTDKKIKFKLVASIKVESDEEQSKAQLWVRVDNKKDGYGFFDNMNDRPITDKNWNNYTIEGHINKRSDRIVFGGLVYNNGKFFFDKFEILTENKSGEYEPLEIQNGSFEIIQEDGSPKGWSTGIGVNSVKVKGFSMSVNDDAVDGQHSFLVEGTNIQKDTTNLIGPIDGYSPQMGTLVTMLNNLSTRVESIVGNLSQQETDHLLDDEANSIGALIMHLAATEVIYQAYTFEDREFNKDEQEKWGSAMDLGQAARDSIKGKDIKYYLAEWKKVREKTIEGLKKRDDEWLAEVAPGSDINNHFAWFHVMEHQSSHLGQILLLRKRLPEFPKEIELEEKIKD